MFRLKADEERVRKEEDKARKEFIKQEYLRRKQLKLMKDMDTIIKPRAAGGAKQRRTRPKSIHRDSIDSPKTPVRAATGNHGDCCHSWKSHCQITVLHLLSPVASSNISFSRFRAIYSKNVQILSLLLNNKTIIINNTQHYCN